MEFHQKGGNGGWIFKTIEPHFFKIVLEGTLRDGKLGIPKKFVTKYGNNLSNPARLTVPSGEIWRVELVKSEGEIWYFQVGWTEFAEFYSLAVGHFLVFQYKGGCHFHVLIFDRSATEIEYPMKIMLNGDKGPDREERFQEKKMEETEILDEFPPSRKTEEKFVATTSQPDKRMRIDPSAGKFESCSTLLSLSLVPPNGNQSGVVNMENTATDANVDILAQSKANAGETHTHKNRLKKIAARTHALSRDEKNNAYIRAGATFKSNSPFFMIVMQPSYVSRADKRARIPSKFARKYFKQHGDAVLCGLDGRIWYVSHNYGKFSKGWKEYAQDNHLEVGDVCIFELIKGTESSFNVAICRVVQNGS